MSAVTHSAVRERIAQLLEHGTPEEAICFRLRTAAAPPWTLQAFEIPGARRNTPHAFARDQERLLVREILEFRGWRVLRRLCERWIDLARFADVPACVRRLVQHFGVRAEGLLHIRLEPRKEFLGQIERGELEFLLDESDVPLAEDDAYHGIPHEMRPYLADMVREKELTGSLQTFLRASIGARVLHDLGVNLPRTALPAGFADFLWRHRYSSHWDKLVPLRLLWDEIAPQIRERPVRELLRELHVLQGRLFFEKNIGEHLHLLERWRRSHWLPCLMPRGYVASTTSPERLRARFLERSDPRGVVLGELTGCCQSVGQSAGACAWHGQEDPLGAFFVVEDSRQVVLGQSWVWRDVTGRAICFDSIECLRDHASRPSRAEAMCVLWLRAALWCLGQNFGHGLPVGEVWVGASDRLPLFRTNVPLYSKDQCFDAEDPALPSVKAPALSGVEGGPHRSASGLLFPFRASWLLASTPVLVERDRLLALPDKELLEEFRLKRAFNSTELQEALRVAAAVQAAQVAQAEPEPPRFPEAWAAPASEPGPAPEDPVGAIALPEPLYPA